MCSSIYIQHNPADTPQKTPPPTPSVPAHKPTLYKRTPPPHPHANITNPRTCINCCTSLPSLPYLPIPTGQNKDGTIHA